MLGKGCAYKKRVPQDTSGFMPRCTCWPSGPGQITNPEHAQPGVVRAAFVSLGMVFYARSAQARSAGASLDRVCGSELSGLWPGWRMTDPRSARPPGPYLGAWRGSSCRVVVAVRC